jgi:hypothetical protein
MPTALSAFCEQGCSQGHLSPSVYPCKNTTLFRNDNEYSCKNAACQANNLGIVTTFRGNIMSLGFFIDKILRDATYFKILTVRKF